MEVLSPESESAGGAEEEQPEPQRVAAAELEVAAAAAADPVEELADAGLLGMLRREALAVQAPRPLVAVGVVDARGDGVERRQVDVPGPADRASLVLGLVARPPERFDVLLRRLAPPVAVA